MTKAEPITGLDQEIPPHPLVDRRDDRRRPTLQHRRELPGRETRTQHGCDADRLRRITRQTIKPVAHRVGQPTRQTLSHHLRTPILHPQPVLLLQTLEQLDQQERDARSARRHRQQTSRRLGAHGIRNHRRHRLLRQWRDPQTTGTAPLEPSHRLADSGSTFVAAPGEYPEDRRPHQPRRQRGKRPQRAAVGPMDVIEKQHQRPLERGGFKRALELMKHPIRLLAQHPRGLALPDRRITPQRRVKQRRERDGLAALRRLTEQRTDPHPAGHDPRLRQQTALADPRRTFDKQHARLSTRHARQTLAEHRQLTVPAAQEPSQRTPSRRLRHLFTPVQGTRIPGD